jgi:hypothetical protein
MREAVFAVADALLERRWLWGRDVMAVMRARGQTAARGNMSTAAGNLRAQERRANGFDILRLQCEVVH